MLHVVFAPEIERDRYKAVFLVLAVGRILDLARPLQGLLGIVPTQAAMVSYTLLTLLRPFLVVLWGVPESLRVLDVVSSWDRG